MLLTVFTPTFNRAELLGRLFKSLSLQNTTCFEWVIVDDGSSDYTKQAVLSMQNSAFFSVRYYYQENSGKHTAINKGLKEAKGDFFFIVDSDDWLPENSLSLIVKHINRIENIDGLAGIVGLLANGIGDIIGGKPGHGSFIGSLIDYRYRDKYRGDRAEVFKTEILKKFPFPIYKNEKFCPEALVWNRIAIDYKFLFFEGIIYSCEYLPGGLTDRIFEIRKESPIATLQCYSEQTKLNIPVVPKLKAGINYWRFAFYSKKPFAKLASDIPFWNSCFTFVPGILISCLEKLFKK